MTEAPDIRLLTLTQWLSPAFPLGAFAYSHGLEAAVTAGEVTCADSLRHWLTDILTLGAGRSDAILLACALRGADPAELAGTARALCACAERWEETRAQGAAFARTVAGITGAEAAAHPLPVAVGAAARALDLPPETVISLYLQGFAGNLVSCGIRFIPLGQTAGQGVLAALHRPIAQIAAETAGAELCDIAAAALGADLAAMRHETLPVRIYRT